LQREELLLFWRSQNSSLLSKRRVREDLLLTLI
jgi:hypothetical protein